MDKSRLERLREIVQSQPDDTFARYGLAMELSSCDRPREAWEHFNYLLTHHPNYSPAYYHAGRLLASQGRREEAKKILAQGIEVTGRQENLHSQSELQAMLDELQGES